MMMIINYSFKHKHLYYVLCVAGEMPTLPCSATMRSVMVRGRRNKVHEAFLYLLFVFMSKVYQLLLELKEKRKESVKNKHSAGQQNLNTVMFEVG